jgi:hypothetical protein
LPGRVIFGFGTLPRVTDELNAAELRRGQQQEVAAVVGA